eukprot:CAMPEP_0198201624 /NCGR_PEP_ID=MMETSP1445-20131203/4563_1 /TAXON_ID=36898 /ORGANISM="Pyramimonas sp., Strain CCMP2087" /LENGTH=50 /DNA_ID=CAMNT_0043872119 /DNA_START=253 /DNA_END=402 /DNA_ORIENTATION=-
MQAHTRVLPAAQLRQSTAAALFTRARAVAPAGVVRLARLQVRAEGAGTSF